ncbi:MAG: hypothetical protein GX803_00980 [Lentisphaerae bacterium]|jgi:hypothetical protein|nr:hypothetical protein [Lentisphaerota bacterium]
MSKDDLMIRCQQCGASNRLPTIHCKHCGARLDYEKAEKSILKGKSASTPAGLRNTLRGFLILALVAVGLLLIWPQPWEVTTGTELDARRYRMKVEILLAALEREAPEVQTITEAELNGYLQEQLRSQAPTGRSKAHVENLGVAVKGNRLVAYQTIAWGPLTLTSAFTFKSTGETLQLIAAQTGHLPLPGILGQFYANGRSSLVRQFQKEHLILQHLNGILLEDGSLEVLVNPKAR